MHTIKVNAVESVRTGEWFVYINFSGVFRVISDTFIPQVGDEWIDNRESVVVIRSDEYIRLGRIDENTVTDYNHAVVYMTQKKAFQARAELAERQIYESTVRAIPLSYENPDC